MLNAPRHAVLSALLLLSSIAAFAQFPFQPADWALHADFPSEPKGDEQRTPTPHGDEIAQRQIVEAGTDRLMLIRFVYPIVPAADELRAIYKESVETLMRSRSGRIVEDVRGDFGEYPGLRLLISHAREKTHREVRLVLIGASLYVATAEWAGGPTPSPVSARFLKSLDVQPSFLNPKAVADRERWREIVQGSFKLRYDATRWFRDPEAKEPGSVVLLRVDELGEAEFITSPERNAKPTMEETVLGAARENAEWVKVIRRGKKYRGSVVVEDLRFSVRTEGQTFENHGYYFSGAEGTVQVRGWASDKNFPQVEGDISELLNGLTILRGGPGR